MILQWSRLYESMKTVQTHGQLLHLSEPYYPAHKMNQLTPLLPDVDLVILHAPAYDP